jgi:hypothetical protein
MANFTSRGREILRKWKIPIMRFYYRYYRNLHKDFVDSKPRPPQKKGPETLMFGKTLGNQADI